MLECILGESHQHQPLAPGEMARRRLAQLVRGGEVDEAVLQVHRGAFENALAGGIAPFSGGEDLVEQSHGRATIVALPRLDNVPSVRYSFLGI
jgi:hypothetical protein